MPTLSIKTRVTRNDGGDLEMTVTLVGVTDVIRFAHGMRTLQCEFGDAGRNAMRSIRRQMGPELHDRALRWFGIKPRKGEAQDG